MYRILAKTLPRWTATENLTQRIVVKSSGLRYFADDNVKNTSNQTTNKSNSEKIVNDEQNTDSSKWGGFAKAYDKFSKPNVPKKIASDNQTFSELLRNSPFVDVSTRTL